jgi:putative tributyrin esterase
MVRTVNVLYPESRKNPDKDVPTTDIPVLYLLHGMSGNPRFLVKPFEISGWLEAFSLAVVMPSTDLVVYEYNLWCQIL